MRERERVNLTCEARGYPEPQILWRREDGKHIYNEFGEKGEQDRVKNGNTPKPGSCIYQSSQNYKEAILGIICPGTTQKATKSTSSLSH